jgi:hypothetical protein
LFVAWLYRLADEISFGFSQHVTFWHDGPERAPAI